MMKNTRKRRIGQRYRSNVYRIRFLEDIRDFPNAPSILSEGDSWFGYPFGLDLNDQISLLGGFNIRHFEKAGDELINDMMGEHQRKLLTTAISTHQFDLVLYSGGGNDIVADNLTNYILDEQSGIGPKRWINGVNIKARIAELKMSYEKLIKLIHLHQGNCPIVVHGYDNIIPSDKGFEILGFKLTGPWVKPTLDAKGVAIGDQASVINHIMDLFNIMLRKLSDEHANFHYIDLRGTLKASEWANEIHPTSAGFGKLANKYEARLRSLIPRGFT